MKIATLEMIHRLLEDEVTNAKDEFDNAAKMAGNPVISPDSMVTEADLRRKAEFAHDYYLEAKTALEEFEKHSFK